MTIHETTLPLDFSPLREEAERLAAEYYRVECSAGLDADAYRKQPRAWESLYSDDVGWRIEAQARLLADLTRTASSDFWLRWLAADVGICVKNTPPRWMIHGSGWILISDDNMRQKTFSYVDYEFATTDPLQMLRAIIVARERR